MKVKKIYDEDNDILSILFGKVEHSIEIFEGDVVVDFDKKNNVVGLEIFDFSKEIDKSQKKYSKIWKQSSKI